MHYLIVSAIVVLALFSSSALAADASPDGTASPKAGPTNSGPGVALSPIRVLDARPVTLVYKPFHGTYAEFGPSVGQTLPALYATLLEQHARVSGSPMFVFPHPSPDHADVVDVQVGVPVQEGTAAPAGFAVRRINAFKAGSSVVTGAGTKATIGQACQAFYSQLNAFELAPHGELHMRWLYWDPTTPANNVIQLEVEVQP